MKIDKAIHSVNNNKSYLDFWEPVSMIWKEKFEIEPVLFYFYRDYMEENIEISEKYGKVIRIKMIKEIPEAIQVMWSRYYMTTLFPEEVSIICDIDMFPMSTEYFVNQIKDYENTKYLHINPAIETYGLIPSCYHIATGNNFKKYLELPDTWEQSIIQVVKSGFGRTINGNPLWFADEEYATNKLMKNKDKDVEFIPRRGGLGGFRIDRSRWHYEDEKVLKEYYFDCHSIRPFEKYKQEIEKLINLIMNSEEKK